MTTDTEDYVRVFQTHRHIRECALMLARDTGAIPHTALVSQEREWLGLHDGYFDKLSALELQLLENWLGNLSAAQRYTYMVCEDEDVILQIEDSCPRREDGWPIGRIFCDLV